MIFGKEDFIRMYVHSEMSIPDISAATGKPKSTIRFHLHKAGVIRKREDWVRLALPKYSNRPGPNTGKKMSRSTKNKISEKAFARWADKRVGVSLKPSGYYEITCGPNKGRNLHRVIMEEFLGRKLNTKEHVHHINGIKTDNRIENLQVISHREHSRLHGIEKALKGISYDISKEARIGEDHRNATLTERDVIEIRRLRGKQKYADIASIYGVTKSCITSIMVKRTWKHI